MMFSRPITLLPGETLAVYCHSSLPDDLGIQYQSYRTERDIVALSPHLVVWPGLGHTASVPFDDEHGWYRSWRGIAGTIEYRARVKGWNLWEHKVFPAALRAQVKALLLTYASSGGSQYVARSPHLHRGGAAGRKSSAAIQNGGSSSSAADATNANSSSSMKEDGSEDGSNGPNPDGDSSSALVRCSSDPRYAPFKALPLHVLYNIMEYMVSGAVKCSRANCC